jgi:hypothetical protein
MGERGQIEIVLFRTMIADCLSVRADCLSVFADCFLFLLAGLENLFFKKLMQLTKKCPMFFPPCMVCPEEGRDRDLGGEGMERGWRR